MATPESQPQQSCANVASEITPGTILELHLSKRTEWNGHLVEVQWVIEESNDYAIRTLERPYMEFVISPEFVRQPTADRQTKAESTTPAPSLDSMPPERGTILELLDIGEDYDGKLVELRRVDRSSGRYLVSILDDENETHYLRVKKKCCKRPDLKPLKTREYLNALSAHLTDRWNALFEASEDIPRDAFDEIEALAREIYEEDPCCVSMHELLAAMKKEERHMAEASTSINDAVLKSIEKSGYRHMRLTMANLPSYEDILEPRYIYEMLRRNVEDFSSRGRSKEAARIQEKLVSSSRDKDPLAQAKDELAFATSLLLMVPKHHEKGHYAKEIIACLKAADQLCCIFEFALPNVTTCPMNLMKQSFSRLHSILNRFEAVHACLDANSSKMLGLAQSAVDLVEKVRKALQEDQHGELCHSLDSRISKRLEEVMLLGKRELKRAAERRKN